MSRARRTRPPLRYAAALAIPVLVLAGCVELPWSTFEPASDFARTIDGVYDDVLGWTIGIFFVVEALLLYALFRYRRRPGDEGVPTQVHGHTVLELGWTLVPAVILFFITIPTLRAIFSTQAEPPGDPLEVEVVGHQWWWEFRYPDLGVVTANELHLPRGRTARLTLTSADVIHSFWSPRLGGKRDMNPGSETTIWFTPDSAGEFSAQCAEFCGTSHANMRFLVIVDEPAEFETWAAAHHDPSAAGTPPAGPPSTAAVELEAGADSAPGARAAVGAAAPGSLAGAPDSGDVVIGDQPGGAIGAAAASAQDSAGTLAFLSSGCAACHTIRGTPAQGKIGPNLTGFGARRTLASGILPNTDENLAGWLRDPDSVKPGALMPDLNLAADRVAILVTYLRGLR